MGERRDLKDLLRDTDFTQKRIIDDLANSENDSSFEDRGVAGDLRRSEGGDIIKNFFVGILLVGIVVGSFWISFLIGKKVLVPPVKNLQTFDMSTPKAITSGDLERATPVNEGAEDIKEREITEIPAKPILVKKPIVQKIKAPVARSKPNAIRYYKVIAGTFKTASEANALTASLKERGFESYIKKLSGYFRVQAGAFDAKNKAAPLVVKLRDKGFTPTLILE